MNRIVLMLVIALSLTTGASGQPSGPPPANVVMDAARQEWIEPRREVTGELRAIRLAAIASEQAGLVAEVAVEAGDSVTAGTVLIRLDDKLARLELQRAESQLKSAQAAVEARQAQLARARNDYESLQRLGDSASEKELIDARADVVVAEAQFAGATADELAAQAQYGLAAERFEDMVISAPFAGAVTQKLTEVGQWIGVGDTIIEMVDISVIDAWLDVPESLLPRLQTGDVDAQIRVRATGEVYAAPVSAIVPQADRLSRLFPVRVRIENPDGLLRPGMSIVGLAPTGAREQMITIHKDALMRDDAGAFVYISANGVATPARIRVLFAKGDRLVVESPMIRDGVEVVIEGNERLFPGQPLIAVNGAAHALSSREN